MEQKRFHSVRLEREKCRACTNCLKRCPTEAIRVRGGSAHIIDERCIDCGECIRVCEYHAKVAVTDPLSAIEDWKYRIALPAPSLYGQFKNLTSTSQLLEALKTIGFDDVFEVARGADVVSQAIRKRLQNPDLPRPVISSACPAIVRLIQVRFPDLIDHIIDLRQPMEVAAMIAKKEFSRKHQVPEKEIGCFFLTPCPAKVTAIRNPIGHEKSAVDGAISVMDIYGPLSAALTADELYVGKFLHLMSACLAAELTDGLVDHHKSARAVYMTVPLGAAAGIHRSVAIECCAPVTEVLVSFSFRNTQILKNLKNRCVPEACASTLCSSLRGCKDEYAQRCSMPCRGQEQLADRFFWTIRVPFQRWLRSQPLRRQHIWMFLTRAQNWQ